MAEHDPIDEKPPVPRSAEFRAKIIADAAGTVADGKWRERVMATAIEQIRMAELIAATRPNNFYEGTDLGR